LKLIVYNVVLIDKKRQLGKMMEIKMETPFREFAQAYEEFKEKFPQHPMIEEVRSRIVGGKLPSDQWLAAKTAKMKSLMAPFWLKNNESKEGEAA
jgi:hypothetical protein